jgi:hypothetical protein
MPRCAAESCGGSSRAGRRGACAPRALPLLAALLAACGAAAALPGSVAPKVPPPSPLVFFCVGGAGGSGTAPFTSPGQLAAAAAMTTVAGQSGSHPAFVLSAGDNFFSNGLAGAWRAAQRPR